MLDAMEFRANLIRCDIQSLRERFGDADKSRQYFRSFSGKARHLQGIPKFRSEARPGIARDGDVVDFGQSDACGVQAIADCRGWESRGVLHTVKALFFDCGDQAAVGNQCC